MISRSRRCPFSSTSARNAVTSSRSCTKGAPARRAVAPPAVLTRWKRRFPPSPRQGARRKSATAAAEGSDSCASWRDKTVTKAEKGGPGGLPFFMLNTLIPAPIEDFCEKDETARVWDYDPDRFVSWFRSFLPGAAPRREDQDAFLRNSGEAVGYLRPFLAHVAFCTAGLPAGGRFPGEERTPVVASRYSSSSEWCSGFAGPARWPARRSCSKEM